MKNNSKTGLRAALEQLPEEELKDLLQAELERPEPDGDSVRLILRVLEEKGRGREAPMTPRKEQAWQTYCRRVESLRRSRTLRLAPALRAAVVLLVLTLCLSFLPRQAQAESFWEMLQRISSTVMTYFNKEEEITELGYSFKTDNPGLQEVYDAVTELGVTDPVVPMWLPEGCELISLSERNSPMQSGLCASFSFGETEIVYKIDIYDGEPAHQFYRDDTYYETYELEGTEYHVTRNNDYFIVVWSKENIECSIAIYCNEEVLMKILNSIYVMEE